MSELSLEEMLAYLRGHGWTVAVHNDYRLKGQIHTFWLFTYSVTGRFLKSEGPTDREAVRSIVQIVEYRVKHHNNRIPLKGGMT